MATYDLEEQEQLAELKAWWKQYGNQLVNALTVVALTVIAWQAWSWYQRNQSAQASTVYHVLQKAVQENDSQRIKAASGELLENFGRTTYAPLGALTSAKAMIDAGDAKTAKIQLLWVVGNAKDELRDLARLRLAALMLDEKAYEEALKQLEGNATPVFTARFLDTRGDVFRAQNRKDEAVAAYQEALTKLAGADETGKGINSQGWQVQSNAVYREILQQKLDSLGGGK